MVKGVSKRVIVVKCPDVTIFDEAIFIIKEDAFDRRNPPDVLKEAQRAANDYLKRTSEKPSGMMARLTAPAFMAVGAAATGIAWLAVYLVGF